MATPSNTTYFKLSIGETPVAVACQRNGSFGAEADTVEVSCKDFNGFKAFRYGALSGTISVEGILMATAPTSGNPKGLADALMGRLTLDVEMASTESGVPGMAGKALVRNYRQQGDGLEQVVTFSAELQMTGEFTIG